LVKLVKKGFILVLILLAFVIGTQNPEVVGVNYLIATSEIPLATLMSICFFIGVVVGCIVSIKVFSQLKWQNYRLRKTNRQLSPNIER
jgi:putative membrane protein